MLSGTDYSMPGPYNVGEQILVINRTAGDSGSFDAKIFYPATSSGSLTPLDGSGGPYPVVSFAHGYLSDARAEHSETARHLASYGYLVVLPSSYESFSDVFKAESLGHDGASGFNYLVTQNSNPSSRYYRAVDTSGFASMGHSMGGAASISEASQNPSVKTIVTWAAQNMIQPSATGQIPNVDVPIQMIAGTQDAIVSSSTTSSIFNSATAPIVLNNLIGGFHFGFTDVGNSIFADSGSMPRATQLGYARSYSVEWLNLYMKGDQSGWRHLWGPEAATDPQVANSRRSRIAVTTPTSQQSGGSGSIINFPITVQNTGTYATSYSLLAEGSWTTTFSAPHTPVIGPGGSATVNAFVTVPASTLIGSVDTVLVSARNNTDGGTRAYTQLQVTAINTPPVADAGGPYAIAEGNSLTLDATATFDPDLSNVLSFSWDVNGDDVFGDATGINPTLDWTTLVSLGISDGLTSWNVRVRVDDGAGSVVISPSALLTLNNAAPTVSFNGPNPLRGEASTFSFTAVDKSSFDNSQPLTYEIDWNGDGAFDETVIGGSSVTVDHLFDTEGFVDVRAQVSDHNGATSDIQNLTINVLSRDLIAGTLFWYGTSGDDEVRFEEIAPLTVRIITTQLNGVVVLETVDIAGVSLVHAFGQDGADRIDLSPLAIPSYAEGNDGDDFLLGGSASDTLNGGLGSDTLWGGLCSDVVDGGSESDVLYGEYPSDPTRSLSKLVIASDTILGGGGSDLIYGDGDGGEGAADQIDGDEGNDTIYADGAEGTVSAAADTVSGGDGDDTIYADGAEGSPDVINGGEDNDFVDGGRGNDLIEGGNGDDILLGGDSFHGGNDAILGGNGRDLIAGDFGVPAFASVEGGKDSLDGGVGQDIVIAGALRPVDAAMVFAIHSEWISGRSYEDRVANISGTGSGPRSNGDYYLTPGTTVTDDRLTTTPSSLDLADAVLGGEDQDWLWLSVGDDVGTDLVSGELAVDLAPHPLSTM